MRKSLRTICILLSFVLILSLINASALKVKAAGTVDDFVERCYTVTLGRGSDPDGFADWKGQLLNGEAVGVHVAYGFLFSPEYTKKNKNPEDYVTDLYMLFMGREPDEAGFNDWVGQLKDGKSRVEVFVGFANSQEFYNICESYGITAGRFVIGYDRLQINNVNLFVERLYKVCFGRIGDIGGQKNWVEKLVGKQITGSECARSFIQSQEYENLRLSDEDYVENLYIAMMGRASDAEGKNNWVNGLANGMTRDEVFAGFANSVEFGKICDTYKIKKGNYTAKDVGTDNKNEKPNKSEYQVGQIIKIGRYEQDGDETNGKEDIEWQILAVENNRILVISKYGLDCQPYNLKSEAVTWETSSLRKWLNEEFYNSAFNENEKKTIPSVLLENKDNAQTGAKGGNKTEDKIFLLSIDDIEKYFGEYQLYSEERMEGYNENLLCEATPYAINQGAWSDEITSMVYNASIWYNPISGQSNLAYRNIYSTDVIGRKWSYWLLRSPGASEDKVFWVFMAGLVRPDGPTNSSVIPVRPAMYIDY